MDEKKAKFLLGKDTVIMCLHELINSSFSEYEGDKRKLKDMSDFDDADLLDITEDDWKDIGHTWNALEPRMNSYFEIRRQTPEKWFRKEE